MNPSTPGYWTLSYLAGGRRRYCAQPATTDAEGRLSTAGMVTLQPALARRFDSATAADEAWSDYSGMIIADLQPHFVETPLVSAIHDRIDHTRCLITEHPGLRETCTSGVPHWGDLVMHRSGDQGEWSNGAYRVWPTANPRDDGWVVYVPIADPAQAA